MYEGIRRQMEERENELHALHERGEIDREEFNRRERELQKYFDRIDSFLNVGRFYRRMS